MQNNQSKPKTIRREKRPDGRLYAVAGASRSGKTAWTAQQVANVPRLLVWDFKHEWFVKYRCRRVSSLVDLAQLVKPGAKPQRLALACPGMDQDLFIRFCRLAFVWLRADVGTLVVEEVASVTNPGKAPAGWGDVLRMGLGFGCDIYSLMQRTQEGDKTALGNASVLHCHRLAREVDRRAMAQEMDVSADQIRALKPLEFIERDASGELRTGVVTFRKSRK